MTAPPIRTQLLDRLWTFQRRSGYIRDADVKACADWLNISTVEVEGVVSFYHFFHRQPAGALTIYLDNSIVAEHAGLQAVQAAFERATGAKIGGVDPSGRFGLFHTPCIGLSDQQPAALINFVPFTRIRPEQVDRLVLELKRGASPTDLADPVAPNIQYVPPEGKSVFFREYTAGKALARAATLGAEGIIEELKIAELSGRGGAFYPTGLKWNACRQQAATPKYVICNADEGEPGTFKDRALLQVCPQTVLEGMIIAGLAIGAAEGVVYLRAEYTWLLPQLEAAIRDFRTRGLLGKNAGDIAGFDFDIRIQLGAGAYVCGEETALLESMEGKRGEPRTRWFFPVERGFLQQPTLINNVETFAAAAHILDMGAAAYCERGIPGSPGVKLISVSGDCGKPGVYEIEWGMPVAELLERCEAKDPYFMQVSGPSGECLSMAEKDRRISMLDVLGTKDVRCGGSFMVFNQSRDLLRILLNFSAFFKHESCGVCTPCRAGNFILQRQLEKLDRGLGREADLQAIRDWGAIMKAASRCGLGKTAPNTPIMAMEKFHADFAARLHKTADDLNRAFDLKRAEAEYEKYKTSGHA
ncbi:MAG: NAD(P)H-dependent oxidoreductase subunit E [Saprospirales bacterium]|nr:NAD(P)H-dependent oxidoreductase subunit E [Saprospirales bacterium]